MELFAKYVRCGGKTMVMNRNGDSVERLVTDMARAVGNATTLRCQQQLACGYFGHCGIHCQDGGECPAYGDGRGGPESCLNAMRDDIARRCESLGIDLKGGGR